jgi:hypothetical protein
VCRSKHVKPSINFGIINSITSCILLVFLLSHTTMHESMNTNWYVLLSALLTHNNHSTCCHMTESCQPLLNQAIYHCFKFYHCERLITQRKPLLNVNPQQLKIIMQNYNKLMRDNAQSLLCVLQDAVANVTWNSQSTTHLMTYEITSHSLFFFVGGWQRLKNCFSEKKALNMHELTLRHDLLQNWQHFFKYLMNSKIKLLRVFITQQNKNSKK